MKTKIPPPTITPISILSPCAKRFQKYIDNIRKEGNYTNGIIYSLEDIFHSMASNINEERSLNEYWDTIKKILREFQIKIVIGYRHYHELLVSLYNQLNKPSTYNTGYDRWPTKDAKFIQKPGLLPEYIRSQTIEMSSSNNNPQHHATNFMKTIQMYQNQFGSDNVFILDLNEHQNNLTTKFVCDILEEANHTCASYKKYHEEEEENKDTQPKNNHRRRKMNASPNNVAYDILIANAFQHGLLNQNVTINNNLCRSVVRNKAQQYYIKELNLSTNTNLSTICLSSEDEETLLNLTLMFAKQIRPNYYYNNSNSNGGGEDFVRQSFDSYQKMNKFCSVNASKEFNNTIWIHFFQSLSSSAVVGQQEGDAFKTLNAAACKDGQPTNDEQINNNETKLNLLQYGIKDTDPIE